VDRIDTRIYATLVVAWVLGNVAEGAAPHVAHASWVCALIVVLAFVAQRPRMQTAAGERTVVAATLALLACVPWVAFDALATLAAPVAEDPATSALDPREARWFPSVAGALLACASWRGGAAVARRVTAPGRRGYRRSLAVVAPCSVAIALVIAAVASVHGVTRATLDAPTARLPVVAQTLPLGAAGVASGRYDHDLRSAVLGLRCREGACVAAMAMRSVNVPQVGERAPLRSGLVMRLRHREGSPWYFVEQGPTRLAFRPSQWPAPQTLAARELDVALAPGTSVTWGAWVGLLAACALLVGARRASRLAENATYYDATLTHEGAVVLDDGEALTLHGVTTLAPGPVRVPRRVAERAKAAYRDERSVDAAVLREGHAADDVLSAQHRGDALRALALAVATTAATPAALALAALQ
jgi:hypothetical protein